MSKDKLSKLIDKHQSAIEDDTRDYIGASSIGSECLRQIWYQFKGVKGDSVSPKIRRTWSIGSRLEGLIIEWLVQAGVKVYSLDVGYSSKGVPLFRGHVDSLVVINKKNCILEIKTAKDASFKIFVTKGVKVWNPQYYAQIQSYMGMSELHSAYILVLNKDSSEISDELVLFDAEFYKKLEDKALMIAGAVSEPPRINGSPLFYKCKMCRFNKGCHQ